MSSKESRGGEFAEVVVKVRRCATVVKGGRRFSFAGLVVIGNGRGRSMGNLFCCPWEVRHEIERVEYGESGATRNIIAWTSGILS